MLIPYDTSCHKKIKSAMSYNFGKRMADAREICGMSQLQASSIFGFVNSSRISKIEKCDYGILNSLHLLPMAVLTYEVSSDFLLGLSDYSERNVSQARQSQIQELLASCIDGEIEYIRKFAKALDGVTKQVQRFDEKTRELLSTLVRLEELNPEFENMPNSAKLARLIHELRQDAKSSTDKLAAIRESINRPEPNPKR